ncbi:hypothetical protein [Roseovarius sp. D22-M7]|uniref:hypothetical protein n=1 Tax=Roseovarius sp. D22-M7 TaxID=3127116 RepID=UPI00300FC26C
MTDTPQVLRQHHLEKLRLPTFNSAYDKQARARRRAPPMLDLRASGAAACAANA